MMKFPEMHESTLTIQATGSRNQAKPVAAEPPYSRKNERQERNRVFSFCCATVAVYQCGVEMTRVVEGAVKRGRCSAGKGKCGRES